MSSKPLWYQLFYSSPEEIQKTLENRIIPTPIKRDINEFSYHEDMGFAANEYLMNHFKPLPITTSFGYVEPCIPDTTYLEDDDWDEAEYLDYVNEQYEDNEEEYNDDNEIYESSSSEEIDEDDWTTV